MILLVYPPGWVRLHPLHPLGIATLASLLDSEGIDCRQVDLDIRAYITNRTSTGDRLPMETLVDSNRFFLSLEECGSLDELLERYRPCLERLVLPQDVQDVQAVVFSVMGERQFVSASVLAGLFRSLGKYTLAGGQYISDNPECVASVGMFDFVFRGPAGLNFIAVCRDVVSTSTPPCTGRPESKVIHDVQTNLDKQPKPLFSYALNGSYRSALKSMYKTERGHLVLQYLTDIGCCHSCSFCVRCNHPFQKKSVSKIIREISELRDEYLTNLFSLVSNAINMDGRFSTRLFSAVSQKLRGLEWYSYANPSGSDPELFELLAKSGCRILRFGLESASKSVLRVLNKSFSPDEAANALMRASQNDIWVQVNLMLGSPHETERDVEETCQFIEKHHTNIDSIRINPFYLQKGSRICENPDRYGIRIRSPNGGVIAFDEIGGLKWEEKVEETLSAIDRVFSVMQDHGIGYYAISSNLLLCALRENGSKLAVKLWLANMHPYTCENLSFEVIRWNLYHAYEMQKIPYRENWRSLYGLTFEERHHDI